MTPEDEGYFARLEDGLDDAMAVAREARAQGRDPTTDVEIPVARDMADRVEKVLGIDGVAERVRELEGEYSREEAALELVTDFVEGTVGDYEGRAGKVEGAVRTAVALLTEGVVAAPIEGIDRVELLENDDGSEFINVYYAGPIRSAGGTAQALSVLVADYARSLLGIEEYRAREAEVERYAEEVDLYDRETGLQYSPADAETRYIARHMPIMLDGEATGDEEVSGYRDLDRVDTNAARGGMCLVLAEGMALKAPKIQRYTRALDEVSWPWLDDLIEGTVKGGNEDGEGDAAGNGEAGDDAAEAGADDDPEDGDAGDGEEGPPRVEPSGKYLRDLIAGRPVFGHPSEPGGFRLRYGRARNHGFATAGVHPATMRLVDDFLAAGTQLKTERPGKAAGVVPVDSIEGPTVRLANGDVRRIDDPAEAAEVANGVEAVLDLGEYLVNFGEFVENNHPLAPASYAPEWWRREFEATDADVRALADDPHVDLDSPTPGEALDWAEAYDCPLHPAYTYLWHDVSVDAVAALADAVAAGDVVDGTLVIERTETTRRALECLLVEHGQREDALQVPVWRPLARSLGVREGLVRDWTLADLPAAAREYDGGDNAIRAVNTVAPFEVRERAPTRIGCRMGRPEKSEERELSPAVHSLFPIGEAGGNTRDVSAAADDTEHGPRGRVEVTVADRACPDCGSHTYRHACPDCGSHTEPHYECGDCGTVTEPGESGRVVCPRCDREVSASTRREVDLKAAYRGALEAVGERESGFEILKGVKGLTSRNSTPEPLEKGVLRAKHGVSAFKDGTVRYDMTDLPVTAVRPAELDVTAERFRELGYETDVAGDPLRHDDQLVELRVQDVVLSDGAAEHLLRTADFVDDLLESTYDLPAFYRIEERADLVGELVFGMAPHTSAATVGRIVGFTSASVGYAHPYFHAAKRRNCFHPDTKVWYEDGDGWRYERIEALVEDRLDSGTAADDFGTAVRELDGGVTVPSVAPDGTVVRKPVEAVSKHAAPDHMIRIRTGSGRGVTVTPDHEVHVIDGGEFDTKHASAVDAGDRLVTPTRLDAVEPAAEPPSFDLLAAFLRTDAVSNDRLAVRGIGKKRLYDLFETALADGWDGEFHPLTSTAERLGVSKKRLSNYVYRDSVPAGLLADLFDSRAALLAAVPDDVRLGVTRDSTGIDRHVRLDERVATLLGYYAAEGFTREQETPKGTVHQTTVCGTEHEPRAFVLDALREELGVEPYRENGAKITASGRLLRAFVDMVLDAGSHAHTKRVPQPVFDAPDRTVAAYLRGYFSGDGSVDGTRVSATTVSPELREDVVALLTRLGIESRVRHGDPRPLAEQFPAFYDEDAGVSRPVYTVSITGEAAVRFADEVGFHLPRKDDRLRENVATTEPRGDHARCFDGGSGDCLVETVERAEIVESDADAVYCVTVADTHTLVTNDLSNAQCDGDEDCVMLLMDGLLNFSKSFLPDQRGGSVAEDSRLLAVDPDGRVRHLTFDDLWTELESPVRTDGKFRKRACAAEGWRTYAFDENHEASLQPIEKAIRYPAGPDEELLRVETQYGRSLEITPEHSLFRYDDGIEAVAGDDLEPGDLVVAPRRFDVEPTGNVVDTAACVADPYVFIDDRVEEYLRGVWDDADRGSDTRAAFDGGLSYRLSKRKVSLDTLREIETKSGDWHDRWNPKIGLRGSSKGIRRHIPMNERFAWLLGLFAAEGSLSTVRPTIANSDEAVVRRVERVARDVLGTAPSVRRSNGAYEVGFPAAFREVLFELGFADEASYDSSEKVVPDPVLRAESAEITAFLRGFIAGDGSRTSDDNHTTIGFHTTSEDLKDGLVFLLHRLGIVAAVSRVDRPDPRQTRYDITVSGGASDNPLARLLDGDEPYRPKSQVVTVPDALLELRATEFPDVDGSVKQAIPKYLKRRENVSVEKLGEIIDDLDALDLPAAADEKLDGMRPLVEGDLSYLRVQDIDRVEYDGYLYDLQVGGEPIFAANGLYAHNSMDAPLVMSSRVDPTEIDDEAHNMDVAGEYPRELYEASRRLADPGEVDVELAGDSVGTDAEYGGFDHTHDVTDIAMGPDLSAYKTLGDMETKMDAQLELARTLRAVDETDVAERVIEYHFLPDLIGNLRAFASQETRCLDCGESYRRPPLTGDCRECGGDVTLTVYRGSVTKYIDTAVDVAERFGCREYTKQRLKILEQSLESIFEDDTNKQSGIADFM